MATRSYIGVQKDDKVEYIYCHHDGYLNGVGIVLVNCYKSLEKAQALISLGNISSIAKNISNIVRYDEESSLTSLESYLNMPFDASCFDIEYFYLFKDKKWHYAQTNKDFRLLNNKLILQEALKRMG